MLQNILPDALMPHPPQGGWAIGQAQSLVGVRITVSIENAKKRLIGGDVVDRVSVRENKPNG